MKHRRKLLIILSLCSAIIFLSALETLLFVKSEESFVIYQKWMPGANFKDFLNSAILRFVFSLMTPVALSLYSYFTFEKMGTPKLFRIVWGLMVFMALALKVLERNFYSLFFDFILILYMILFFVVINVHRIEESNFLRTSIRERKKIKKKGEKS